MVNIREDVGQDRRVLRQSRAAPSPLIPPPPLLSYSYFSLQFHEVRSPCNSANTSSSGKRSSGAVLFETQSEKVYTLNPTAAAIIQELGTGCNETELTQRLADRFQAPMDMIEHDVAALIAHCGRRA